MDLLGTIVSELVAIIVRSWRRLVVDIALLLLLKRPATNGDVRYNPLRSDVVDPLPLLVALVRLAKHVPSFVQLLEVAIAAAEAQDIAIFERSHLC